MIQFKGTYFDGKSSKEYPVSISFDGNRIRIRGKDGYPSVDVALEKCVITAPLGKTSRSLRLPDGAKCETLDHEAISELERFKGENTGMRFVHALESRWKTVVACLTGLILCVWAITYFGIPHVAKKIAESIPLKVNQAISSETLKVLDERFFRPSELSAARMSEIRELFDRLNKEVSPHSEYQLEFRKSPVIGANAFALPAGLVIVTDELVKIAVHDNHLLGIFAHEMAHIRHCHSMRSAIQSAGVFLLISALIGDVTSITSMAGALPTLLIESGYSREFEREADKEAGLYFIRKGCGTKPYRDILLLITENEKDFVGSSILSSHPKTKERIDFLSKLEMCESEP